MVNKPLNTTPKVFSGRSLSLTSSLDANCCRASLRERTAVADGSFFVFFFFEVSHACVRHVRPHAETLLHSDKPVSIKPRMWPPQRSFGASVS